MKKTLLTIALMVFAAFIYAQQTPPPGPAFAAPSWAAPSSPTATTGTTSTAAKPGSSSEVKPAAKPAQTPAAKPETKPAAAPAPAAKPVAVPAKPTDATAKTAAKGKTTVIEMPKPRQIEKDVIGYDLYKCPKCGKIEAKPGKCPICKEVLVKTVKSYTWKCMKCGFTSSKDGDCPVCRAKLKKHEVLYMCVPDNINQGEPGKCPKCGHPLSRKLIPPKAF